MENANVEKVKKEPMTAKQKTIFGLKIAGNVVFYAVIILLFLFSIMNINANGRGGIPNLFGKGYLSVKTNSMTRDSDILETKYNYGDYKIGSFSAGDLLIVDVLNEKEKQNLQVGDVVTFWDESLESFNTHRIVYATFENGKTKSITLQGDKTATDSGVYDPFNQRGTFADEKEAGKHAQMLTETPGVIATFNTDSDFIKAKVTKVNHGGGAIMDNIQDHWLWYFVVPVLVLLLFEVFMVIKNFMDLREEKHKASLATDKEAMMAEIASEKEKMRQELLAELKAQQQAEQEKEVKPEEKQEETVTEENSKEEALESNEAVEVKEDAIAQEESIEPENEATDTKEEALEVKEEATEAKEDK